MKKAIIIGIISLGMFCEVLSGMDFLNLSYDARDFSLGDANVAETTPLSALNSNPGGLVKARKNYVGGEYIKWYGNINYGKVGFVSPAGKSGAWGVGIDYTHTYMENTNFSGEVIGETFFSYRKYILGIGYKISRFDTGVTIQYNDITLADNNFSNLGINLGCIYHIPFGGQKSFIKKLDGGIVIKNLSSSFKIDDSIYNVDMVPEVGLMGQLKYNIKLFLKAGYNTSIIFGAGMEALIKDILYIRGGYSYEEGRTRLVCGGGINVKKYMGVGLKINYATSIIDVVENVHYIGIEGEFN